MRVALLGIGEGLFVGFCVGANEGGVVGRLLGIGVGLLVGLAVGNMVWRTVGKRVGFENTGAFEGRKVGL